MIQIISDSSAPQLLLLRRWRVLIPSTTSSIPHKNDCFLYSLQSKPPQQTSTAQLSQLLTLNILLSSSYSRYLSAKCTRFGLPLTSISKRDISTSSRIMTSNPQKAIHDQSLQSRDDFWLQAARQISWHKQPTVAFGKSDRQNKEYVEKGGWFPNAESEYPI